MLLVDARAQAHVGPDPARPLILHAKCAKNLVKLIKFVMGMVNQVLSKVLISDKLACLLQKMIMI